MQLIKSLGWAADGVREPVQELPADVRGRPRPQPLPREDPLDVRAEPLLARGRLQHHRRRVLRPRILPPRGPHRDAPGEVNRELTVCLFMCHISYLQFC